VLAGLGGRPSEAIALLGEALPGLREAGDGFFLSFCLVALVHSQAMLGDFTAAESACLELDAIGDAMGAARIYFAAEARGWLAFCQGQWPQAVTSFRDQTSYYSSVALRGMWTGNLAWSELVADQLDTARRRLHDFLRTCLAILASIKAETGSHLIAARLADAAVAFRRSTSLIRLPAACALLDSTARACQAALGPGRFAQAWAQGEAMTLEGAAAYASRGRGKRRRPARAGPVGQGVSFVRD